MRPLIITLLCLAVAMKVDAQGIIQEPFYNWTEEYDPVARDLCLYITGRRVELLDPSLWVTGLEQPDERSELYNAAYGLRYDPEFNRCIRVIELFLELLRPAPQREEIDELRLLLRPSDQGVIITLHSLREISVRGDSTTTR
jgi:hypothetical protein